MVNIRREIIVAAATFILFASAGVAFDLFVYLVSIELKLDSKQTFVGLVMAFSLFLGLATSTILTRLRVLRRKTKVTKQANFN